MNTKTLNYSANFLPKLLVFVFLFLFCTVSWGQQQVTGTVIDANGDPIVGASVLLQGTSTGGVTNIDGEFSVPNVPTDGVLVISYIGFSTQNVKVGSRSRLNIVLQEDKKILDEVVVVGYGTITKRSVSTAMSTVKGEKIAEMPTSNVAQSLAGMSSAIYLQQTSGEPGAAPSIRIRGAGSINSGNDPLYVIDGYPTTDSELFTNLNPNDIGEIQILKDAASSAIYGSKAGNGVIIVTTKRGQAGMPKISFSTQLGISQIQNKVKVLGAKDYLDMLIEARTNNNTIENYPELTALKNSGKYFNTDWQDEIFRNALNYRANVNVNGGTNALHYNFSANYQNEDGTMLNSFYRRLSVNGGFDVRIAPKVKLGFSFSPTINKRRTQDPSGGNTDAVNGVVAKALTFPPILPVYQPNGDYTQVYQHYSGLNGHPNYGLNQQIHNPVADLLENRDTKLSMRTTTHAFLDYTPVKNLVLRTSINFNTYSMRRDYYQSAYLRGGDRTGNKSTPNLSSIDAYRMSGFGYNAYWSTTASYTWDVKELHHFNIVAGYDLEYHSRFNVRQDDRTDADNPIAYNNTAITNVNGALLWTGSSENTSYTFDGMFTRLVYDFDSKYVLSGSLRRDRSSKFGPENRAGWFYSGSTAWNISEEQFMKSITWLNMAKLRVSYGVTGNDQVSSNYGWVSTISSDHNVIFGTSSTAAYYPSGYSNRELGWEKNRQWDLGLDLGFLSKYNLTIDLYTRTSDIVMPANIPNFNGVSGTVNMNSGQIRNRGVEVQVVAPLLTGAFKWQTSLNWSLNRNKILSLANNQTQLANGRAGKKWSNVIRNYVGRPMGDIYLYRIIGMFNTEEDVATKAMFGTQSIGDIMYEDVNDDHVINTDDMVHVGNYQPKYTFGWNNTLSYRNFDFSCTIDGQKGGKIVWAAARAFTLNRFDDNVIKTSGLGRWLSPENPGNGYSHKAGTNNLGSNIISSTRYLYSSSFIRIRNVTFGYSLPKSLCTNMGIQGLRLSVNANNLMTFDNYPGYSVEANYNGNSSINNGVDFGSYPIARTITFGLNVNF